MTPRGSSERVEMGERAGRWPMIVVHNGALEISVWHKNDDVDPAATLAMAEAGARILAHDDLVAALQAARDLLADLTSRTGNDPSGVEIVTFYARCVEMEARTRAALLRATVQR